jgi:imidazolonepropionase-like amidohydrolase
MLKLLGLVAISAGLFAQSPPVIAIRNARVFPVSGPMMPKATVIVRNGLIAAVAPDAAVPPDAWVLEGEGLSVYPGLVQPMGSVGITEAAPRTMPGALPAAGTPPALPGPLTPATPVARGPEDRPLTNSWVRAADLVRPTERRVEESRNLGYTTSVTFPATGIFTGQGAVVNLGGDNAGRMVLDSAAGQFITLARGGFTAFPGSLMGTLAYIRQVYLDADHYRKAKEVYARNPQGLQRPAYDRALEGVLESPRVLFPAVSAVEIHRILGFAKELGLKPVLYGVHEGYKAAELLKSAGVPVIVDARWPEAVRDGDPDEVESLKTLELRENAPATPAALAKAGVPFALYTAADGMKGVRRAIQAGLTPDQALRAITLSPAQIFGVADRLGSIEKGKIANLVVTKADLFAEKPEIQYVFVDGVRYEAPPASAPAKPEVTQ